ncbi:MAG: hypothetical protein NT166_00305 [Candidatus Aminicenantes bacterium]|nr:hypothetical protein [Candidatus Aminicenantes bacterium]
MFKIIFCIIIIVHGLIHLMGFVKAFKLAPMDQLTQPISKPVGLLWLLTALLFLAAVFLFLRRLEFWWIIAAPAIIISQVLIIFSWRDAKFGTIANLIILLNIILWNTNKILY